MARLGAFFRSQPWTELQTVADGQFVPADTGVAPVAASSANGTITIVYVPAHSTGAELLLKSRHASAAQWFDPAGDASPVIAPIDSDAESRLRVHTPGRNSAGATDWVLVLR